MKNPRTAFGFATRLRTQRNTRDLTQQQLAARSGIHQATISALEKGNRQPSLATARILSSALGCTIDDLIDPLPTKSTDRLTPTPEPAHNPESE